MFEEKYCLQDQAENHILKNVSFHQIHVFKKIK